MTFQLARVLYLSLSIGVVLGSHLVVRTVLEYPDGRSRAALLMWFRAMRLYAVSVAANMAVNLWANGTTWGIWLAIAGAAYLLYALGHFVRTVRGWHL